MEKWAAQSQQEEPGSPRLGSEKISVEITDVLPLFHTSLSLAPMTEVGLIQVKLAFMAASCIGKQHCASLRKMLPPILNSCLHFVNPCLSTHSRGMLKLNLEYFLKHCRGLHCKCRQCIRFKQPAVCAGRCSCPLKRLAAGGVLPG